MSRGSNLKSIHKYFLMNKLPVKIEFVIKTKENAPISAVCKELGVYCVLLPYKNRDYFESNLLNLSKQHKVDLIALSGFLKLLSSDFIDNINLPILNIHPALLPKYGGIGMYGMKVHTAVFEAGEKISGATVHLVDDKYDHGKIIYQQSVDVSECKNPEEIAQNVLSVEHSIYGKSIWVFLKK